MSATDPQYVNIVSGLPRSGTSMMMKMLSEGGIEPVIDNIRVADDDNPKGYFEFEPVKKTKEDASWVKSAGGKVVKMVHLLLLDLPLDHKYRVVFMRRALDEVLASQDKMLQRLGKAGGNLPADKLKSIFLQQIDKVSSYMHEHADSFQFIEINYNDMLQDPTPQVDKLIAFLGDDLDRDAMLGVVDPKLYRQRKA